MDAFVSDLPCALDAAETVPRMWSDEYVHNAAAVCVVLAPKRRAWVIYRTMNCVEIKPRIAWSEHRFQDCDVHVRSCHKVTNETLPVVGHS